MSPTAPPDETPEPVSDQPAGLPAEQSDTPPVLAVLAAVARGLAGLPADADDSVLLEALGAALLPSTGDFCLLHAADASGQLHVVGIAPPATAQARQLVTTLDQQGASMTIYERLVDAARLTLVVVDDPDGDESDADAAAPDAVADAINVEDTAEHRELLRAAGLTWELVVPLHAGGETDALLVIDGAAGQPAEAGQPGQSSRPGQTRQRPLDRAGTLHLAEVLASLVSTWRATRALRHREETLRSRLDESAYAGRELAHTLNNSLTMPVGVVELLLDRNALSADLHEMVRAAASDLAALEQQIRAFQSQMRANSSGGRQHADVTLPPRRRARDEPA